MQDPMFTGTPWGPEYQDYPAYDQVWQRVSPGSTPYPGVSEAPGPDIPVPETPAPETPAPDVPAPETPTPPPMPPQQQKPCCMGDSGTSVVPLLQRFLMEEQLLMQHCTMLIRQTCRPEIAKVLRQVCTKGQEASRKLISAIFLITGEALCRRPRCNDYGPVGRLRLPDAVRELYHREACLALHYREAAESTTDPCLKELMAELSELTYRQSQALLDLVGKVLCRGL